jgi:hypothetical protein
MNSPSIYTQASHEQPSNGQPNNDQSHAAQSNHAQSIVGKDGRRATIEEVNAQLAADDLDEFYAPPAPSQRSTPKPSAGVRSDAVLTSASSPISKPVPDVTPPPVVIPDDPKPELSGQTKAGVNGHANNGHSTGSAANGKAHGGGPSGNGRKLHITLRRSGNLDRDKFRLKEIYEFLCDPRGRDEFFIRLEYNSQIVQLAFPNDACTISERTLNELNKHFRVEAAVDPPKV